MKTLVKWNDNVKLIISDVDETIAGLYTNASDDMIRELERILEEGCSLFLISGQSVKNIRKRIVDLIRKDLRHRILIGHCSGVEVWGFDKQGKLLENPFYSLYENSISDDQKEKWREVIKTLINEFGFHVFGTMPIKEFKQKAGNDPLAIMVEDRGPQITFEVINAYDLSKEEAAKIEVRIQQVHGKYDLRIPLLRRAEELLKQNKLPITPRLAGVFAVDFAVGGVSKTTAVKYVIESESILSSLDLRKEQISPESIEVWGDKFSCRGGTDMHISGALPKSVRSISFREEDPQEFPEGYNIVLWNGKKHLHDGLLEFLKSR